MSLHVIWERLRRFRALDSREQGLFLRAAALLPLLSASLRLGGFGRTQRALERFLHADANSDSPAGETAPRITATARMVHAAVQYGIGRPTCLEQSLALWWLLSRQGIAAQLRIGTRKVEEKFEAHAWVECGGAAVDDPDELHRHYAAFDTAFATGSPEER